MTPTSPGRPGLGAMEPPGIAGLGAAPTTGPREDASHRTAVVVGVLYVAVAAAGVLVLGPAAGTTGAPLAELLALGVGGEVQVITAAAALLLTLGTMNAYFAGAAKLGAALARDGALPVWLAHGSRAGEAPRRSLAVLSALSGLALVSVTVAEVGPKPLVLLTTGSFVMVYALGTAAALRLLPRGSRSHRSALFAFMAVLGLLIMTGWYLLWPVIVTGSALLYLRLRPGVPGLIRGGGST